MSLLATAQTEQFSRGDTAADVPANMVDSPRAERKSLILGSAADNAPGQALNMVIRQDPFSMTLDANALLAGSLFLIMGMHFVPQFLLESLILAVPILLLVWNDYQNFLRLGPGGTPPTLSGYARLAWFRLFILRDPFSAPSPAAVSRPAAGVLASQNLPYRPGPRPTVAGLAPQRQLDQHGSSAAFAALKRVMSRLSAAQAARFGIATSCIEKHGFALFSRHPVNVCGNGEVCHLHNSDRSMHMNLHPDDIAEVLAKGWGQRHPMAWGKGDNREAVSAAKAWMMPRSPLPETFVLVYAPRDDTDLRVVLKIIESAIWYTVEERVDLESLLEQ
ncbi:hypothetical protein KVR01_005632 [Diaporthe batatas]|uniref:uncharacterized protein n=1 Tax=Diaporthe batatas TaxID=748121 RepID=UPI001D05AD76|nr:uncharacterized protein KVR01_005632 [Diaporthe batatas]KAG8165357.1 hypothetical protein KVR01_005632 [Diaporthe batatas]